jgi:outer membrane lipoprotein-sorting protein
MKFAFNAMTRRLLMAAAVLCFALSSASAQDKALDDLLNRTAEQMSKFVDQFADVKCTEHVTQERYGKNSKIERKAEATYDYLMILTNTGGELSVNESRLEVQNGKQKKDRNQTMPLLISNGFATLFLVFHPYYANDFSFSAAGEEMVAGRELTKIHFKHVPNTPSVAVLAVRGKEYPLDLSGTAWIDAKTGLIAKIDAGVTSDVEDIGMKALRSEVQFAPVHFGGKLSEYWFPTQASVEIETAGQHWRNTHNFTDYKQFSVSTEEQVAKQ